MTPQSLNKLAQVLFYLLIGALTIRVNVVLEQTNEAVQNAKVEVAEEFHAACVKDP